MAFDPSRPVRALNTMTGEKEALVPASGDHVRMYVCGVTVYGPTHAGHARAALAFDVVYRYLLHRGLRVTYVRNFTDVDDKIIRKAHEEGVDHSVISQRYIDAYHRAVDALHLLRPDVEPRVTETMDEIVAMVETLVARGHAYPVDGDVYFDVSTKPDYGKLSGREIDEQERGARVEVDPRKRNAFDFALWKAAKPGEPAWPSPWGEGRPGWHIECSAMSTKLLGPSFELHGGGCDLIFPHHENEIAQSEGASGVTPCVSIWMHNGHLTVDARKMAKSDGNFFTVEEVTARYHPESLRMFFLSAHYRAPLDFNEVAMAEAEGSLERLYHTLAALDAGLGDSAALPLRREDGTLGADGRYQRLQPDPLDAIDEPTLDGPTRGLYARTRSLLGKVEGAMDDDFNTAKALGLVFEHIRKLNQWLAGSFGGGAADRALAEGNRDRLLRVGAILGIFHSSPTAFFDELRALRLRFVGMSEAEIEAAIAARADARARKDFAAGDTIRDGLLARGVALKDGPGGTVWEVQRGLG